MKEADSYQGNPASVCQVRQMARIVGIEISEEVTSLYCEWREDKEGPHARLSDKKVFTDVLSALGCTAEHAQFI